MEAFLYGKTIKTVLALCSFLNYAVADSVNVFRGRHSWWFFTGLIQFKFYGMNRAR
jgi:hypothetical protein